MNLICGVNPVIEALRADSRHFARLLVVKGLRNRRISEAISHASELGVPLRFEARETLDRLAGGVSHQGLIGVVSAKAVIGLQQLLDEAHDPALLVVLDGIEDPRNLGAILRTCEAVGSDGVLLPQRRSAGLSETVARASAGALEHMKIARIGNVAGALQQLKQSAIWIVGLDAGGTERWDQVDFQRPVALVVGGEGQGMRRLVREHCDHLVSLPLFGHVDSLNVSVAAGVALYEVVRQRGRVPSQVRPIPVGSAARSSLVIVGPSLDDSEDDPGYHGPPAVAAPEGESEQEEQAEPVAEVVRLHHDEDSTWNGPGPVVIRSRPQHGRRWGERPRKRPSARRGAGARAPAPEAGDGQKTPPAAGKTPARRRRRRGRRAGPADAAAAHAHGATAAAGPSAEPSSEQVAVQIEPPKTDVGDVEKRPRARRRRRRPRKKPS